MDQPTPGSQLYGIRKGRCWPLCSCCLFLFLFALDLVAADRVARHLVFSSRHPSTPALSQVSCCHANALSTPCPSAQGCPVVAHLFLPLYSLNSMYHLPL